MSFAKRFTGRFTALEKPPYSDAHVSTPSGAATSSWDLPREDNKKGIEDDVGEDGSLLYSESLTCG